MKRFITVLSSLLVLPAFAEVAPVYYDEIVEYTDDMIDEEEPVVEEAQPVVQQKNVAQRNTINRSTSASRAISASSRTNTSSTSSRAIASSPRSASTSRGTVSRAARTNTVVNRTPASRTNVTSRNAHSTKATTARVGTRDNAVMAGSRNVYSSSQATLNDSGNSLYNSNTAARISVGGRRANARISSATALATATPVITEEDISTTTNNLTAIAELTDYCKAQYATCMDNYCNVLDDNQGRCSCSKNIKNYANTEAALAKATEEYESVVQQIRYIGLTKDQITTLFNQTDAELEMDSSKNKDKSSIKSSLDKIRNSILIDASSPKASSYTTNSGISFDLSGLLSLDSNAGSFDLNSLFGSTNSNTSSVSNQRGEQLYKTATNRCKTAVLNSCVAQGIDANVITNSYDLEIDKQCIAYERSLNETNSEMRANARNAVNILQQARLMLAQNKNSYDLRGCVAAIDSCMQDEYVCGSDYELCLDSTGKYISEGKIIAGAMPGIAGGAPKTEQTTINSASDYASYTSGGMYDLYTIWNYDTGKNAWGAGDTENLSEFIDSKVTAWKANSKDQDIATYLLNKIGYIDSNDKAVGMCASIMKQCQDYTYKNAKYQEDNAVVRQYLASALTKIKLKQDSILSDYAENCRSDVSSCLTTNGYDADKKTTGTINVGAVRACATQIATCMSVTGYKPNDPTQLSVTAMSGWTNDMLSDGDEEEDTENSGD